MTKRKAHNPIGRNQFTARKWEVNGELKTTRELAVEYGISYQALHNRLVLRKWPMERALKEPIGASPQGSWILNQRVELPRIEIDERHQPGQKMSFAL